MIQTVHKNSVHGVVTAPTSKSYAQRAIIAALLAKGTTSLTNFSLCSDVSAALNVVEMMGVSYNLTANRCVITSPGFKELKTICKNKEFNVGESGLLARLLIPILSLFNGSNSIIGTGSIMNRPMDEAQRVIEVLGGDIILNDKVLPALINGGLRSGVATIDGSLSSQFLSGLLMALPLTNQESVLTVEKLKSKPYIDMTLDLLTQFGIKVQNDDFKRFNISGEQDYTAVRDYEIEGDWSSGAYLLTAAAIAGELTIEQLSGRTKQADRAMLHALDYAGAKISMQWDSVSISRAYRMEGFSYDATNCPDLIPAMVALASSCEGESTIVGSDRLIHKESNRLESLKEVYSQLGITLDCSYDNVIIVKGGDIKGGVEINTHNDHRIAMSAAIAALRAEQNVVISDAECVNKSYPNFWVDFQNITK